MFITDHEAGPWNSTEVSSTSVTSVIELLPDRIIQYIGEQGYSRTYIQFTDPTLDPEKNVLLGDIWIIPERTWGDLKAITWSDVSGNGTIKWGNYSFSQTYYWDGSKWCLIADGSEIYKVNKDIQTAYTRITETQQMILQEAERSDNTYISKTAQLQTADSIVTEAVRQAGESLGDEFIAKTTTYQDAESIVTEAVRQAASSASGTYIAKTTTYQTADSIVTEAVRQSGVNAANGYIAKTSTYQDAESIVTKAEGYTDNKLTSYSTTTQTNTLISQYVTNNAYKIQSGIAINASGVDVTGSKYVKISSGASFLVESDYVTIDSTNKVVDLRFLQTSSSAAVGTRIDQDGLHFIRYIDVTGGSWSRSAQLIISAYQGKQSSTAPQMPAATGSLYIFHNNYAEGTSQVVITSINFQLGKPASFMGSNAYPGILTISNTTTRFVVNPTNNEITGIDKLATFSEYGSYSAGSFVNYNGRIYKFTSYHEGAWTGNDATLAADGTISFIGPQQQKHAWMLGTLDAPFYASYINNMFYKTQSRMSSLEYKKDVNDIMDMGQIIDSLRPVSFHYKTGVSKMQFGLIYEEAIKCFPDICTNTCGAKGIDYGLLIPVLLKETQQLRKRIKELEEKTK